MMQDTITIEADTWGSGRGEVLAFTCNNVTTNLLIDADDERALLELLLSRQREREGGDERTVQVPMSQLERWRDDLVALLPPGTYAIRNEVNALLSRPTPAAEARTDRDVLDRFLSLATCPDDASRLARLRQALNLARQRGLAWPLEQPTAEPPSTEDMAPGTTFTAEGRDGTERLCAVANIDHTVADLDDCVFRSDEWFDPSTIRDVTPPACS